ncbi:hypothetical protein BH09MYX1_BH09MYX1_34180 [soil metagenome]
MPPGWYPDPSSNNQQRWWDGRQWGTYGAPPPATYGNPPQGFAGYVDPAVAGSRSSASLAHYLGLLGFLGPLIILMTAGPRDVYVRAHAVEAVNFHITALIGWLIVGVVNAVTCGLAFPLAFGVLIPVIYFGIQAGSAASRGEWYRYPWTIRMVT